VPITSPRLVNPVFDPIKRAFTVKELINPVFALILEVASVLVKNPCAKLVENEEIVVFRNPVDTRLAKFAVDTRPVRFAVDTRPVRFAVDTRPVRFVVDTRPTRFAVETRPARLAVLTSPISPYKFVRVNDEIVADDAVMLPELIKVAANVGRIEPPVTYHAPVEPA
jgi:hypothetical protein